MSGVSLAEFLLARIAEDEALARDASPGPWHSSEEADTVLAYDGIEVCEGFALSGPQLRATTRHIARHDPARVLAQCEAKRRLVEDVRVFYEAIDYGEDDVQVVAYNTLRALASVYADHPDYDPAWRP